MEDDVSSDDAESDSTLSVIFLTPLFS